MEMFKKPVVTEDCSQHMDYVNKEHIEAIGHSISWRT